MNALGFAAVPNWMIRDSSISRGAVQTYMALASRSGPGGIFPSQATLAGELDCSERSVRRWLKELEERGVIERVPRRAQQRGTKSALPDGYVLHPNGKVDYTQADTSGRSGEGRPDTDAEATGHSLQVVPLIEEEPVKKNPARAELAGAFFEEFYSLYPRKVGKVAARKAFEKALALNVDAQAIVDGARKYANDPNLPDKQFIPYPASWLNAGRWEDEPLPPRGQEQQVSEDAYEWDWAN